MPLKDTVKIVCEDGIILEQKVQYDWKPQHCEACNCFGHSKVKCPKAPKTKQVYRVKEKQQELQVFGGEEDAVGTVVVHDGGVLNKAVHHGDSLTQNQFQVISDLKEMEDLGLINLG